MSFLENPPENVCFGCGKANPRGLHLDFELKPSSPPGGERVVTQFVPKEDEVGWPGLLHTGFHQFVLFETAYWAALTLGGKVHRFGGHASFDQDRLPRVGRVCTVEASIVGRDPELKVLATSRNDRGAPCGRLETNWVPASRKAVEAAGISLPTYLLDEMDP
ncbi:MAG: hypothetical protein KGJ23_05950 [Euryarchaeota archaeon]|nr:hypothetical protein [Euryarchaeota archaeon]MDE1836141.1 hypothetical protein [Euryarchaeota archaeon]MDE1879431.1 hypothetical protein [Euryarchaeota archaeon]MDE2044119.1 hypothetical protein [Thermoplasmata archaeon]